MKIKQNIFALYTVMLIIHKNMYINEIPSLASPGSSN